MSNLSVVMGHDPITQKITVWFPTPIQQLDLTAEQAEKLAKSLLEQVAGMKAAQN